MSKEAATLQQEATFQTLDYRLQHFIYQYAQGHRQLSDLVVNQASAIREEVQFESAKTRVHVSVQLQEQEVARATLDQCEKFLKSLTYDTMNARRNRIIESHEKTLNWIFDSTIAGPWDSFLQWLESNQRIYWINGKPGSGKSTLMKFLIDDQRTKDALSKWATNCSIISFFLWNAGTPMQRSVQGILCSLLHQLLMKDSSLSKRLIATQPELLSKTNYDDWSDTELERVLIQGISISTQPLCIFLDGLDEIDRQEGPFYLTDLIERLRSKSTAKLCISSRPEIPLQEAFSKYPKLRVQDLTKADISSFVADSLQKDFHFWDETPDDKENQQRILDEVIRSADGVFLWVHLVLKSLRRGSMHIDSYDQILSRIRELPETLEGLYKRAWERLGDDESRYRAEAARYFRIVQDSRAGHTYRFDPPFSLFDLSIACDDKIQSAILDDNNIPPVAILLRKAENCRRRVEGCCGGLLEIWGSDQKVGPWKLDTTSVENFYNQFLMPLSAYVTAGTSTGNEAIPSGKELGLLWNTLFDARVEFIHRTAADFLVEAEAGKNIISSDHASASEIRAKLVQSQLVRTLIFHFPDYDGGQNTSDDIFCIIDNTLPDDMQRRLQILVGDIYERILTRAPVMEHIITQLRLQIRHRQFDAALYRSLCDFTNSTLAKNLSNVRSFLYASGDVGNISIYHGSRSRTTLNMVPYIREACILTLAKYEAGPNADVSQDVNWPVRVPRIQVPRHTGVSSDDLRDLIFAHLLFTNWILVDARRQLQYNIAEMAIYFLRDVVNNGLVEVIWRWFDRRRGPYNEITDFKEKLMYRAKTPETQKLLESVLQSGVKVADLADQLEGRTKRSSSDLGNLSFPFVEANQKEIYKALFPDMTEFDNTEVDVPNLGI
jgi:hypothetical protein